MKRPEYVNSLLQFKTGRKDKAIIRMLHDNQEMSFQQIAKAVDVPLANVYKLNRDIESGRAMHERIVYEHEKSDRLDAQMRNSDERRKVALRKQVERLHFEEGMNVYEIRGTLFVSCRIINDILSNSKQKGAKINDEK